MVKVAEVCALGVPLLLLLLLFLLLLLLLLLLAGTRPLDGMMLQNPTLSAIPYGGSFDFLLHLQEGGALWK